MASVAFGSQILTERTFQELKSTDWLSRIRINRSQHAYVVVSREGTTRLIERQNLRPSLDLCVI